MRPELAFASVRSHSYISEVEKREKGAGFPKKDGVYR